MSITVETPDGEELVEHKSEGRVARVLARRGKSMWLVDHSGGFDVGGPYTTQTERWKPYVPPQPKFGEVWAYPGHQGGIQFLILGVGEDSFAMVALDNCRKRGESMSGMPVPDGYETGFTHNGPAYVRPLPEVRLKRVRPA